MTTARSFGNYDLAAALADLIDNSITARARAIEITCEFNGSDPVVRVRDDGHGMSPEELLLAMRPASCHPAEHRSVDDLGRFGWGMKSASFSQAKCLTVVTRKDGQTAGARWDLDDIDDWSMSVLDERECKQTLLSPLENSGGTELVWTKCDRLSENASIDNIQFNDLIMAARNRLALIFHRYLKGSHGAAKIVIIVNGTPLEPMDPFFSDHPATQVLPEEVVTLRSGETIRLRAYTLPHYSKLPRAKYEALGGEEGYVKNQGFYVFRNNRLIISGTWFKLAKHGELSKLVRISIDISNNLDAIWKITVDKSDAQLPSLLRSRLNDLIGEFRDKSVRVFRSRGGKIDQENSVTAWTRSAKNQQIRYSVNRTHPIIRGLLDRLKGEERAHFQSVVRLVERNFPIDAIFADASSSPQGINQSATNREEFEQFLADTVPIILAQCDELSQLQDKLRETEPYSSNWEMVEEYLRSRNFL